jgi:hypothetical protein
VVNILQMASCDRWETGQSCYGGELLLLDKGKECSCTLCPPHHLFIPQTPSIPLCN